MCAVTMKFVVIGRALCRRITSASARWYPSSSSEEKRWKSRTWPGLRLETVSFGVRISSQSA